MPTREGGIGKNGGNDTNLEKPVPLGIKLESNEYPNGKVTFEGIGNGAYWKHGVAGLDETMTVYLCNSDGTINVELFTFHFYENYTTNIEAREANINYKALKGKDLYIKNYLPRNPSWGYIRNYSKAIVNTEYDTFSITKGTTTGSGTWSINKTSAGQGETVTITATPTDGWQFSKITTSVSTTINGKTFTMPGSNVTVNIEFTKKTYSITKKVNPSGAGSVSQPTAGTGTVGETFTVAQSQTTDQANNYRFSSWSTSPTNRISGSTLTMPASDVTITANYQKRSTASVDKKTVEGGGSIKLTISSESANYTHKYRLNFGTGMDTGWQTVAAGTTTVTINVPANWSAAIPNVVEASGTLSLQTFTSSTQIGSDYQITGMKYTVPASVKPSMGTITTDRVLTIGNVTYNAIDSYYVQNHCGVRIRCSASGQQSATISKITVTMSGYSGGDYSKTVSASSVDFTSKVLYLSGTLRITVTATDSRGRTSSATKDITVQAYSPPAGTLAVRRVDNAGNDDPMGDYGDYVLTKQYTQLGSNSLSWSLTAGGSTENSPANTGHLLPSSRKTFSETLEYDVTLQLQDALETVTVTTKLPSARFVMYVDKSGNKIGFMKVPNQNIPSGKARTFEISADTQVYIGSMTLEDYIRSIT